jgi:hypothetical protein
MSDQGGSHLTGARICRVEDVRSVFNWLVKMIDMATTLDI